MKPTIYIMCLAICLSLTSCAVNKEKTIAPLHDEQLCGGFTHFRSLSADERILFDETYKSSPALEPFEVATQVVAGTNYRFRCRSKEGETYIITIYQPLPGQGSAEVTSSQEEEQ